MTKKQELEEPDSVRIRFCSICAVMMQKSDQEVPTLTPLSFRRGVRGEAMGVRLLGGLNKLGAVGLRNGALGIPLRGAVTQTERL